MENSKELATKYNAEYEGIKFFIKNSRNRFRRVKSGCRLKNVLELQSLHIQEPLRIIENLNATLGECNGDSHTLKTQEQIYKEKNIHEFFKARYNEQQNKTAEKRLRNFLAGGEPKSILKSQEPPVKEKENDSTFITDILSTKGPVLQKMRDIEKNVRIEHSKQLELAEELQQKPTIVDIGRSVSKPRKVVKLKNASVAIERQRPRDVIREIFDQGRPDLMKASRSKITRNVSITKSLSRNKLKSLTKLHLFDSFSANCVPANQSVSSKISSSKIMTSSHSQGIIRPSFKRDLHKKSVTSMKQQFMELKNIRSSNSSSFLLQQAFTGNEVERNVTGEKRKIVIRCGKYKDSLPNLLSHHKITAGFLC